MQKNSESLSQKEHTLIPDSTFPINIFHLHKEFYQIIPPHWHDHFEWLAITKGSFRVQVEARFEDVREGDAIFVNARQVHSAFPIEENSELYAVVFNEALLRNSSLDSTEIKYIKPLLGHEALLPPFYRAEQSGASPIHAAIVKTVEDFREKRFGYELLIKSALFAALGHAFQYELVSITDAKTKHQAAIQPLLVHLSQHFCDPISIEKAAQMICVSPNYFCALFKKATGKTLLEYVNLLRVHEAEQLLRTRLYSIEQVALKVGYTNTTYFGRVFKKYKNQTAREYLNSL
ncbi:helix-turn-helix transcriptional regulator [Gorillibacterium massiliense]|uniref:helix-turn-helix transcriptional regulator n=1 Tax=Gorillibacterium massiliense TaxID=1280390 RepID=UPI0004B3F7A7|nr:AraC family transcriptional regulator [Gorillibacterium massiliense]